MQIEEYHERVASAIAKAIEAGTAPWQKPWAPGVNPWPRNEITGHHYQGVNPLLLLCEGYGDPRWIGFSQAKKKGGCVRKGENGTPIIRVIPPRPVKDDAGNPVMGDDGQPRYTRASIKILWVWNVEQVDGLKLPPIVTPYEFEWEPIERAEAALANSGITIKHANGSRAYYNCVGDVITLPEKSQFPTAVDYYHTALHELVHATGHESRLGRDGTKLVKRNELATVAREELIAEIGALMAGEKLGTGSTPQHGASYVESWLEFLRKDPQEIIRAASAADLAANWIVNHAEINEFSEQLKASAALAEANA